MEFYVHVSNVDSDEPYPHNRAGNFIIRLPRTIELTGEWEMSLAQIHFKRNVDKTSDPRHIFVCTDIVDGSVVGKAIHPILRDVGLKSQGYQIEEFVTEQFHRINHFWLQQLHIYFLGDEHTLVELKETDTTDIVLHFRRKPLRICSE